MLELFNWHKYFSQHLNKQFSLFSMYVLNFVTKEQHCHSFKISLHVLFSGVRITKQKTFEDSTFFLKHEFITSITYNYDVYISNVFPFLHTTHFNSLFNLLLPTCFPLIGPFLGLRSTLLCIIKASIFYNLYYNFCLRTGC